MASEVTGLKLNSVPRFAGGSGAPLIRPPDAAQPERDDPSQSPDRTAPDLSVDLEPARPGEKRLASIVAIASLLAFLVGLPFVRTPLPHIPALIPGCEAALWISDTITAVLLFSQFMRLRSRAVLVLAAGYLFDW